MEKKFVQISSDIIEKIKAGELLPGDKVPSENEIIQHYQVSNTTARKSLLDIELKGWVKRIKGKGTFVLNRTEDRHLLRTLGSITDTRIGFNEKLMAEGFEPKNIIIEKTVLAEGISSEIAGKHYIIDGPVLKVHQLRYANDIAMKDEIKYISLLLCPKINLEPTEVSYYKVYEMKYGLTIKDVNQALSAEIVYPDEARHHFDVQVPTPAFVLDSAVISTKDKVIEVEHSFYRGDKYKFAIKANLAL
ncbi:GntR family transcriptional regulator [Parapedobacter sp. DT-150]|uniref:GntR family transcriptional regulator n=1 Tax=Parapedobacter sp. DT-150 TaxID=3396162 RepID=UPI003F1C6E36